MARSKHNDDERRQWVENDEGLYNMARRHKGGIRKFIRENREMIDSVIDNVVSGRKPAHYLEYGDNRAGMANHRSPFGMFS
jgi:sarcosine oxidase delta subunit